MDGRIPAGFDSTRVWLLLRTQQGGLVLFPGRQMPSLAPLRGSALEFMWGELIVLSGFGDIQTVFVHASAGIWISLGFLPMIAGLSPLMS